MSIQINLHPSTNASKWESVKSGDFLVLDPVPEHPIPHGLYRIFIIGNEDESQGKTLFIIPMFDGPFEDNMFPYMIANPPPPTIVHKITKIKVDAEVSP
jgi:hypothetical protein